MKGLFLPKKKKKKKKKGEGGKDARLVKRGVVCVIDLVLFLRDRMADGFDVRGASICSLVSNKRGFAYCQTGGMKEQQEDSI